MRTLSLAALLACSLAAGTPAVAQENFPTRTVTLIAPSSPGSTPDVLTRLLGQGLAQQWGEAVVVENRAGAGGDLATDSATRADPDGYTILLGHIGMTINPHIRSQQLYSLDELMPVAMVATAPDLLVVHPSVPATDVATFLTWLKENPDTPAAHAGTGTTPHLSLAMLGLQAGVPYLPVPYKGGGATQAALLANEVDFMFSTSLGILPAVRSGQLRALAVTSPERLPSDPEIPTLAESGLPDFQSSAWFGLFVPAKTPQPVVDAIAHATRAVVESSNFANRLIQMGAAPQYLEPAAFADFVNQEYSRWGSLVEEAGLQVDQ